MTEAKQTGDASDAVKIVKLTAERDCEKAFTADELAKLINDTGTGNCEVSLMAFSDNPTHGVYWVSLKNVVRIENMIILEGRGSSENFSSELFSKMYNRFHVEAISD